LDRSSQAEGLRAPVGQFANAKVYPTAASRDVTAPNTDALYSSRKRTFLGDGRTFHDWGMAGGLGEPSQAANDFTMIFHDITAEWCWGYGSVHPGLARKTRSVLNLAVLTCRLGTQVACTGQDPAGMPARLAA